MIVPRLTTHKQKREVFAFSSVSPYLPLFPLIIILRYLKSSTVKYSKSMRRSNGFSPWLEKVAKAYCIKYGAQKTRRMVEAKAREEAKKKRLVEKKKKKKRLEYIQQLQNEILAKDAAFFEGTEESQITGSKCKERQWPSKKAKGKQPRRYCRDTRVKMEGAIPYKRCVCTRQNCLVHNSKWVTKFLFIFFSFSNSDSFIVVFLPMLDTLLLSSSMSHILILIP